MTVEGRCAFGCAVRAGAAELREGDALGLAAGVRLLVGAGLAAGLLLGRAVFDGVGRDVVLASPEEAFARAGLDAFFGAALALGLGLASGFGLAVDLLELRALLGDLLADFALALLCDGDFAADLLDDFGAGRAVLPAA